MGKRVPLTVPRPAKPEPDRNANATQAPKWVPRRDRGDQRRENQYQQISSLLLAWYARGHRELPWRDTRDPYAIWVSEIMLQQTRAAAVIPYYERFLKRFPTVADLAAAGES